LVKIIDLRQLIDASRDVTSKMSFSRGTEFEDADKIVYGNKEFQLIGVQRCHTPPYCYGGEKLDETIGLTVCWYEKTEDKYYIMHRYLSGRYGELIPVDNNKSVGRGK